MSKPISGACLCGRVKYRVRGPDSVQGIVLIVVVDLLIYQTV